MTATKTKIRIALGIFMGGLIISGISAFPLETETAWLAEQTASMPLLHAWAEKAHIALKETNYTHPFLAYGTDWLGFAHIIIALLFIGPWRDPQKNTWIIEWGMIACIMIFPLAGICGSIRGIPMFWQLIDCSFGVLGLIPLVYAYNKTKSLKSQTCSHKAISDLKLET